MSRPALDRWIAGVLALATFALAAAASAHHHAPGGAPHAAEVGAREVPLPAEPEAQLESEHFCLAAGAARLAPLVLASAQRDAAPAVARVHPVRQLLPVCGVPLYRVGPERAPPVGA